MLSRWGRLGATIAAAAPQRYAARRMPQLRGLSDQTRARIDKLVKEHDVVVFMKGEKSAPQCGFSNAVVQILRMHGTPNFRDVNVLADEDLRQGIKEYTPWPTIPQVFVRGEFVGGCDILLNMHQSGELEGFLREKGISLEDASIGAPSPTPSG